jgi:hypothetical protein
MKRFVGKTEAEKLLNEEQFSAVFMEYLQCLDEFDAQVLNQLNRMKSLRYHVDIGLEEHPELCRMLYKKHEEQKMMKKSSKLA